MVTDQGILASGGSDDNSEAHDPRLETRELSRTSNIGAALDVESLVSADSFMRALFEGVVETDRRISIFILPSRRARFFATAQEAAAYAGQLGKIEDVYFGCGLCKPGIARGRGTKDDIVALTMFWADLDFGPGHKKMVPPDEQTARRILANFPLPPSIIVSSGGGLHAYWLLVEPWVLPDESERERAGKLAHRFVATHQASARAEGYEWDQVGDLPRILRVAGTFNHKRGVPLPVSVTDWHPDRRYRVSDVEPHLINKAQEAGSRKSTQNNGSNCHQAHAQAATSQMFADDDLIAQASCAANGEKFASLWNGDWGGYASQSEADLALCCMLAFWTAKDAARIDRLFRKSRLIRPKWDEPHSGDGRTYGEMTIDGAIAKCGDSFNADSRLKLADARAFIDLLTEVNPAEALKAIFEAESVELLALLQEHHAVEFESAMDRLRDAGVRASDVTRIRSIVTRTVRKRDRERRRKRTDAASRARGIANTVRVRDVLPDAPVAADTRVPGGWVVSGAGVARRCFCESGSSVELVLSSPLLISTRSVDVRDKHELVGLTWIRDRGWRQIVVPRGTIADRRSIVGLADRGVPVNSGNAAALVEFLADFEALNLDALPLFHVAFQMGWIDDGFLWGREFITAGIAALTPMQSPHDAAGRARVEFCGDDIGDEQRAKGLRAEGSLQDWKQSVMLASPYPGVMMVLYASLAAPLLEILDVSNFGIDLCGPSSVGKTISLRVAASVWGDPDERRRGAILNTWDATAVALERTASLLSDMPLILDDTKKAKDKYSISRTIYAVSSGQGRGRGSIKGTRATLTFRSVLISSGEEPATGFTKDGGAHARVLTLWGAPFGATDGVTASIVTMVNEGVRDNYGHAGPEFVRYLLRLRPRWDRLKAWHQKTVRASYLIGAGDNAVLARYADYFAIIETAARLAHRALKLPWKYPDPIRSRWDQLTANAQRVDVAADALRHVASWALANQAAFIGRHRADGFGKPIPPAQGWAGAWKANQTGPSPKRWKVIAFYTHRLHEILEAAGFQPEATLRSWRDRGWLSLDPKEKRLTRKVRIEKDLTRAYVIVRSAIEQ